MSLIARVLGWFARRSDPALNPEAEPDPELAPQPPLTVQAVLGLGVDQLKSAGIDSAARDARLLMAACLDVDVSRITLQLHDDIDGVAEVVFLADIHDRAQRKPMSHILGTRLFYGRRFAVTPDVLDPRGDTETLIEAALEVHFDDVLDLGTGSGCILVTLLAERVLASGIGTDVSSAALGIATRNAETVGVLDRCAFEVSDWFDAVGGTYDLIVSNPPYIAADEMAGLAPELAFEPRMALTDEGDGLSCYRIIAAGAGAHLIAGGWLMVEIGPTQSTAVVAMFEDAGFAQVGIRTDLDGRDRVVVGQKPL